MNKILITISLVLFSTSLFAAVDKGKCDAIKNTTNKIDCLSDLKKEAETQNLKKVVKKAQDEIDVLSSKIKSSSEKNKTLVDVWKNLNK